MVDDRDHRGEAIRIARLAHRQTQERLARRIGFTKQALHLWETGQRRLRPEIAARLKRALAELVAERQRAGGGAR